MCRRRARSSWYFRRVRTFRAYEAGRIWEFSIRLPEPKPSAADRCGSVLWLPLSRVRDHERSELSINVLHVYWRGYVYPGHFVGGDSYPQTIERALSSWPRVNVVNGNLVFEPSDFEIAGTTLNLRVGRYYNSQSERTGDLGKAWPRWRRPAHRELFNP